MAPPSPTSRGSEEFKTLIAYIDKNAPINYFLFTITIFHKYATEFLAPLRRRGAKVGRPDQAQIERRLNLPASHPDNAWIRDASKRSWGQTEYATAYFMRTIKGDLKGEKSWAGERDVWPRWSRSFWGGFTRLQDVYMEEWMWPSKDPEARRVFKDEQGERKMRGALLGLFEEIERNGPFPLGK